MEGTSSADLLAGLNKRAPSCPSEPEKGTTSQSMLSITGAPHVRSIWRHGFHTGLAYRYARRGQ
jgi:hypothetical protein